MKSTTDARAWRRRFGIGLIVAALIGAALTILSGPASAKVITGAITGVTVTPTNPVKSQALTITTAWCVPDGSQTGDTFTLQLPSQLIPYTSGFPLKDAAGDIVANAVVSNGVVTFTLTAFVQSHTNVCGSAYFSMGMRQSAITVDQPNEFDFTAGSTVFKTIVTPTAGGSKVRSTPWKWGAWTNPADEGVTNPTDALHWYLESLPAPAGGYTQAVFKAPHRPGRRSTAPTSPCTSES